MRNIAIIPARSGSKGLKDKNIKLLNGKPLLAYSVEAALESNCFSEVMVSTDSENYAEIARECGASVPFLRSTENSGDNSSSWDMVREVLMMYEYRGEKFDSITLLQPTSPLRESQDIINAFKIFNERKARSVVSICEVEHSPLWCNTLPEDSCMEGFIAPEVMNRSGRQSLATYYRLNGAIYIIRLNNGELGEIEKDIYGGGSYAYCMSQSKSIDIDTNLDFIIAECLGKFIL